jgi:hypothetical protein
MFIKLNGVYFEDFTSRILKLEPADGGTAFFRNLLATVYKNVGRHIPVIAVRISVWYVQWLRCLSREWCRDC